MPDARGAIDLSQPVIARSAEDQQVVQRGMESGAVDLAQRAAALAAQRQYEEASIHQHRWTMTALYAMPEEIVDALADRRGSVVDLIAHGADQDAVDVAANVPVPLPLGEDNIVKTDGPGCIKCGQHWESPGGHGHGCPVSDEAWEQNFVQGKVQMDVMLGARLQELVEARLAQIGVSDGAA